MGTSRRAQPKRLAAKLLQIRKSLGITQEQMVKRLGRTKTPVYVGHISGFENGKREPSLLILLQYARVTGVPVEALIDDDLDLPHRLPGEPSEWVMTRRDAHPHRSKDGRR
ncbi:MAG TPA: helix-turn-helix transcriptional regulator [Pyrinomonadaceae bacterium]|jgi:transcriptional regulator with XRE-family HTH domain|nr:helix-turn-helix transcriptional regulator [Pyrinomonadaceae bacterium]